jgi:hypothetical protein
MKPVLVFYLKLDNRNPEEVSRILRETSENYPRFNGYEYIFVASNETKVECLNPSIILEKEEKNKINNNIKRIIKEFNGLIDKIPFLSKNMLLIEKCY